MKTLSRLVKMEMSNIHFFKPSKNVMKKEMLFMSVLFCLVAAYGTVFMNQVDDVFLKQKSILVVFFLALVAAIYDYATRMRTILYDYNQYKMMSYLPVDIFQLILAKLISMVAVTFRWQMIVGFSFSLVYVLSMHLPFEYLMTCLLLLISVSLLIPIWGCLILVLYYKSKVLGILGTVIELFFAGMLTITIYNNLVMSDYLYPVLERSLMAFVSVLIEIVLVLGLAYFIKLDYREVLAQIEWKDGNSRQVKAEFSNVNASKALYSKEKRAFFSFKLYFMNTMAPVVIFSIVILVLCFIPKEMISNVLSQTGYEKEMTVLLPMFLCFIFGMSNPTYCSLSLEGKAIDVLKSKPLNFKDLLIAKIRVYLTCILPFVLVDSITLGYAINREFSVTDTLLIILFSLVCVMVMGIAGILFDILFGNFEWVNPVTVVKQSAAMPLQMLFCAILVGIPSGLEMGIRLEKNILYFLVALLWGLLGTFLYILTKKVAKKKLGL